MPPFPHCLAKKHLRSGGPLVAVASSHFVTVVIRQDTLLLIALNCTEKFLFWHRYSSECDPLSCQCTRRLGRTMEQRGWKVVVGYRWASWAGNEQADTGKFVISVSTCC